MSGGTLPGINIEADMQTKPGLNPVKLNTYDQISGGKLHAMEHLIRESDFAEVFAYCK